MSTLYPNFSWAFYLCLLLDFGSHWLQFQSTALLKAESHKGKNTDEHWVVRFYYTNYTFFMLTVCGAETATILLYITGHVPSLEQNIPWMVATVVCTLILIYKMLVNCFQWAGALKRIN